MQPHALIEAAFREEHARVLAALISQLGDFDLAEDALQDAIVIALKRWARDGIPNNPGAWLTTVARRRAIDRLRRRTSLERRQVLLLDSLVQDAVTVSMPDADENADSIDIISDEQLKLMFTCCHPALNTEAQVALTLHTLGGLTTAEIARAFLVPLSTMAQRLARARRKIHDAGIPYRVPPANQLPERLNPLLAVLYLIFNEGYYATSGDTIIREELCNEAIRLCRILVSLLPSDPVSAEARGLLALMLLHHSRSHARTNAQGEIILLEEQDRSLWNQAYIHEGTAILKHTLAFQRPGPYQVQAAISAVHAEAAIAADTDWAQIAHLYAILAQMTPSSVIELNRAVAVGMSWGAATGLRLLDNLEQTLANYAPYHIARADLLQRAGQTEAAVHAYQQALSLCQNQQERSFLERRLAELQHTG